MAEPESPRLAFEPVSAAHAGWLGDHWGQPGVRRFLMDDQVLPPDVVADLIDRCVADRATHGFGGWLLRTDGAGIGFAGMRLVHGTDWPEVLVSIEPDRWRQGFGREAVVALLDYSFGELTLPLVAAGYDEPNAGSARIVESLGFTDEQRLQLPGMTGPVEAIYRLMTRDRWLARGNGPG